jgi:hypothetical protein
VLNFTEIYEGTILKQFSPSEPKLVPHILCVRLFERLVLLLKKNCLMMSNWIEVFSYTLVADILSDCFVAEVFYQSALEGLSFHSNCIYILQSPGFKVTFF